MISGAQVRAARALLGWTAKELARKANVGISTVQRIENSAGPPNVQVANLASIQSTLEAAGIESDQMTKCVPVTLGAEISLDENGCSPG